MPARPRPSVRSLASAATFALVASIVALVPAADAAPSHVRILTPPDGSQLAQDGTVPVEVQLEAGTDPATFRATLEGGVPATTSDLTGLFTVVGTTASAALTAAELFEGVNVLTVSAQPGSGNPRRPADAGRKYASVTMSWEPKIDLATAGRCDVLDPSECLFPFPNDHFTTSNASMDTGRRLDLVRASMPANAAGVHIDPAEWNRNDGFSPGSSALLHQPDVDLAQTGAAPITDIQASLTPDAPVMMIDVDTGERIPLWVEHDLHATGPADQALMIRPAISLREGHRHIVALRDLRDASGNVIEAERGFEIYRDAIPTFAPEVEDRRPHFESIFGALSAAGVGRADLFLAWDFTVASERNLSERLLHMRDDAFATLGDDAPAFAVTQVVDDPFPDGGPEIARRVTGTYEVPHYLTDGGVPGSVLVYGPDGLPEQQGVYTADFTCLVPREAAGQVPGHAPGRAVLYGHGLFGSHTQVTNSRWQAQAGTYNMVVCGTTTIGVSDDVPTIVANFQDLSRIRNQPDRSQQGILNTLFLGRLMKHDEGLVSHPAFQTAAGEPAIDTSDLFYTGQSQGALTGGAATAVAQDWTRAVLTAPSMNGSLVLRRSTQGPQFVGLIRASYPGPLNVTLAINLLSILTERGETNAYGWHLTDDAYANTPQHQVLLQGAFADYQTTTISPEIMARTVGMPMHRPALPGDRFYQVDPFFGIPAVSYPHDGSALIMYDFGNPSPPTGNVPPSDPLGDPHGKPSNLAEAQQQLSAFLRTGGTLIDVCGAGACFFP